MSDSYSTPPTPEDVTIERWQYSNPSWRVIVLHPVISTAPGGEAVGEIEVKVETRESGAVLSATGENVTMALGMIDHLISERF